MTCKKDRSYRIRIAIGEESLVFDSMKNKNGDIKWHHQVKFIRVPL